LVDWQVAGWIGMRLKSVHRYVPNLVPKGLPPASTPETSHDDASA
jgi:hypothetical protein